MKKTLKKYFIPHEGNDHKPHILRRKAVFLIAVILIAAELLFLVDSFLIFPNSKFLGNILSSVLVDQANEERITDGFSSLAPSTVLEEAARMKAEDMAKKGYFAHTSPEGITPWHWFKEAGYSYLYAGENLAVNFIDSRDVTNAWMASPTHRANILNYRFTEIGVAVATGTYENREAVFVVQLFGKPVKTTTASSPPAPAPISELEQPVLKRQEPEETFVAVQGAASEEKTLVEEPASVYVQQASLPEKALSMPNTIFRFFYLMAGIFITLALFLKVFIKIQIQHPKLIVGGLLLLFLIVGTLAMNQEFISAYTAIL